MSRYSAATWNPVVDGNGKVLGRTKIFHDYIAGADRWMASVLRYSIYLHSSIYLHTFETEELAVRGVVVAHAAIRHGVVVSSHAFLSRMERKA